MQLIKSEKITKIFAQTLQCTDIPKEHVQLQSDSLPHLETWQPSAEYAICSALEEYNKQPNVHLLWTEMTDVMSQARKP